LEIERRDGFDRDSRGASAFVIVSITACRGGFP